MKSPVHRLALFVATIFVSALPFTADAEQVDEKAKNHFSPSIHITKTIHKYRRHLK